MKLKDQGFEAGDEVVFMRKTFEPVLTTVRRVISGTYSICIEGYSEWFTQTGQIAEAGPQRLFHRDAVTIDEHGRLTAINHDYVKPRPKIVRQSACKFKPFEQVLLRDGNDQPWRKDLFDKRTDAHKPYVGLVLGKGWSQCIPFVGNERLDGVVTK